MYIKTMKTAFEDAIRKMKAVVSFYGEDALTELLIQCDRFSEGRNDRDEVNDFAASFHFEIDIKGTVTIHGDVYTWDHEDDEWNALEA